MKLGVEKKRMTQSGGVAMARATLTMNAIKTLAVGLGLAVGLAAGARAQEQEGVALAIVYDTSGSMAERVPDTGGQLAPKYQIADRALIAVARHLQTFATNNTTGTSRPIQTGLFVFEGQGAREVVEFGPFQEEPIKQWAARFSSPKGNTPLGNALRVAGRRVLASPLPHKHVLVLTDGINTAGPSPAAVLPQLLREARQQHTSLSVHFVAFDVDAQVFQSVKRLGATVVAASNENQLNTQMQFILERKILLEEEEKK